MELVGPREPETFGALLRAARRAAGLSQDRLAERAGLSVDAVAALERGRRRAPRAATFGALADALGLSDADRERLSRAAEAGPLDDGPSTTVGQSRVPRQLPASTRHFVGRATELRQLSRLLDDPAPAGTVVISAIGGTAGIGKTALAVHWAHQVVDRFPDGQLYANLRGFDRDGVPMTPAAALQGFLTALGVAPREIPVDLDAQVGLYRSTLAGRRMLVLLDNARDADQVRPLLPGSAACLVVVTSRNQVAGLVATDGAVPLTLGLPTAAEAGEMLAGRLGAHRVANEPQAAAAVVDLCARLPLALAVFAARAAINPEFPLADLADELRAAQNRLSALHSMDRATDVRAAFACSYRILSPDAARLFRWLGLHPGPDIGAPAAASLAGMPPDRVRPALAELAEAHLVAEPAAGRFALHDLLRSYAAEVVQAQETDDERYAATHRLLDHYLHTAYAADRLLDPTRDPIALTPHRDGTTPHELTDADEAMGWFVAEHLVLLAVIDHAAANDWPAHAWQLAWSVSKFLYRQGHWHDRITVGLVAVNAARRCANRDAQARVLGPLAIAYADLGRYDDAYVHLRHALDLTARTGDAVAQATTHYQLAYLRDRQARYAEALAHTRQAHDLYVEAGNAAGRADALNTMGWYHSQLGAHRQALSLCRQALTLFRELGLRLGQAQTWDSLGYTHHRLGRPLSAIGCYQRSLTLVRQEKDTRFEATVLTHLGDTHLDGGDHEAARTAWRQALAILDELDHPDAAQLRDRLRDLDQHAASTIDAVV